MDDDLARADLAPINEVLAQAARAKMDSFAQEVALVRDGRERHVVAAATRIAGTDGGFDGTVLVVDDVTPLIRAQKVAAWREVARRLPLDTVDTPWGRDAAFSLRWILLHLLEEYARHNGHADLLREAIDGATGE